MGISVGNMGRIEVYEHFMGFATDCVADVVMPQGKVNYCGTPDTTGSDIFARVVDEPGGILSCTTDSDAGDAIALFIGPFKPQDGGCTFEARFKLEDITNSKVFCGFQETLDATTPVLAVTSDSDGTFTHGAVGCHAGMLHDAESDTADWWAVAGDGAVATSNSTANGKAATSAPVNDEFDVIRVELNSHGDADIFLAGGLYPSLHLVDHIDDAYTEGDVAYAVLMLQNETASDSGCVMEVDYMRATGNVDWTQ